MQNKVESKKLKGRYTEIANSHKLYHNTNCREIQILKRNARKIETIQGKILTDFINCSYLGLEVHPDLKEGAVSLIEKWGVYFSASRLRIRITELDMLDQNLSNLFGGYNIVTFSNLTSCHAGVLPLIASGTVPGIELSESPGFIFDITAHSSMQNCRASIKPFGSVDRTDFTNLDLLRSRCLVLKREGRTPILICDGIGSMGGVHNVSELCKIAEEANGFLYIDDAHGISAVGQNGAGHVMKHLNYKPNSRLILSGSLSKGFGAFGGFVGFYSEKSANHVKQNCHSYTFSGPLPIPSIGAALASSKLHLSNAIEPLQEKLNNNLKLFDSLFPKEINPNQNSNSPIRFIRTGEELITILAGQRLYENGIACNVATYPVVAKGSGLLRFSISSLHSVHELIKIKEIMSQVIHL